MASLVHCLLETLNGDEIDPTILHDTFQDLYSNLPRERTNRAISLYLMLFSSFDRVSLTYGESHSLSPKTWPTVTTLVEMLFCGDSRSTQLEIISNITSKVFIPEQILATNTPNLLSLVDAISGEQYYMFVQNSNAGTEYLFFILYGTTSDSLSIYAPLPEMSTYKNSFSYLRQCLAWLPDHGGSLFLQSKDTRRTVCDKILKRSNFAFMNSNGRDHLGHYILNYIGPMAYFINKKLFKGDSPVFISNRNSYLGDDEYKLILPSIENYDGIKERVVHVNGVLDALLVCEVRNVGLIYLSGSRVPLCLSQAITRLYYGSMLSAEQTPEKKKLIIAVGLRGGTRMVLNLNEFILQLGSYLIMNRSNLEIEFIFDGMCMAPFEENSSTQELSLDDELSQAKSMLEDLARIGIKSSITVGKPLVSQLKELSHADIVICHNGSGSAKYLWLLNKPSIILNNHYNPAGKYISSNDSDSNSHVGLTFGRAFRGEMCSYEYYLPRGLISAPEGQIMNESRHSVTLELEAALELVGQLCIEQISRSV